MWSTVETSLDTAALYLGRQDNLCQLHAYRLKQDELHTPYFTQRSEYEMQLDQLDESMMDCSFHIQTFASLSLH